MTSNEKIKESQYNLNELKIVDKWSEVYLYKFNCFITSARSILDHLLEDYNVKYNLQINLESRNLKGEFHEKAKGNFNAEKFIKWYEEQYKKIIDEPSYGFLIKKRNIIVHRKTIKPSKFRIGMNFPQGLTITSKNGEATDAVIPLTFDKKITKVKITTTNKQTGQQKEREIEAEPVMEYFFDENPDQQIDTICEILLEGITKMVEDAHANF